MAVLAECTVCGQPVYTDRAVMGVAARVLCWEHLLEFETEVNTNDEARELKIAVHVAHLRMKAVGHSAVDEGLARERVVAWVDAEDEMRRYGDAWIEKRKAEYEKENSNE